MSQRVDIFDAICGALLLHLYESFPVRLNVEFTGLPLNDELENLSTAEIEQWMEIFFETVLWLEQEGFIRFQAGTGDRDFFGVQLIMSGLAILRAIPESVGSTKQSLIEKLKSAFSEGGKIVSSEGLKVAVGSLISMSSSIG
jgi:hypothetical protein